MEDLNQLLRLPGCYGNKHFPSIIHDIMVTSILPISFLVYGAERQMRYQMVLSDEKSFPVVNWFPWSSKCPKTAEITAITWSNMHNPPRHDCFEAKEVHAGQNEKDYLGFYSI